MNYYFWVPMGILVRPADFRFLQKNKNDKRLDEPKRKRQTSKFN